MSPTTIGDEEPAPGRSSFHATWSVAVHETGTTDSARPCPSLPRNRVQSSAYSMALVRKRQVQQARCVGNVIKWNPVFVFRRSLFGRTLVTCAEFFKVENANHGSLATPKMVGWQDFLNKPPIGGPVERAKKHRGTHSFHPETHLWDERWSSLKLRVSRPDSATVTGGKQVS